MSRTFWFLFLHSFVLINSDTYNVRVSTDAHINEVDSRFLSFTVDPQYLFSSNEQFISKECICMATELTPAYIRIAGPSTAHLKFNNDTLTLTPDLDLDLERDDTGNAIHKRSPKHPKLSDILQGHLEGYSFEGQAQFLNVTHEQWMKFANWANDTGFDLVFALNNNEKMDSGMWDPNSALSILTVAEKANIGNIVWQLGYECSNQSIEEYLNDLETLRLMVESFPNEERSWSVTGGDVTPCLQAESKSDFKDYVILSNDMLDAVMLDGNSSQRELEQLSDAEHSKLLQALSSSSTPLWLSEQHRDRSELDSAADWMQGLGQAARKGFSVHFAELSRKQLCQPSLSFYMALLFKNLVGERVLHVDFETPSAQASLFAHCTSLRHKQVSGAVTLYGANMEKEPARFSLKLSKREEGGDIMQFILGLDSSENIVVNGRVMYYAGDIKPVVKRVRPYKTLLINLPPKSFGFWVLANTTVEACYDAESKEEFVEAETVEIEKHESNTKIKRSVEMELPLPTSDIITDEEITTELPLKVKTQTHLQSESSSSEESPEENHKINCSSKHTDTLMERIKNLTKELKTAHQTLAQLNKTGEISSDSMKPFTRTKRETKGSEHIQNERNKRRRQENTKKPKTLRTSDRNESTKLTLAARIQRLNERLNKTRTERNERAKQLLRSRKEKVKVKRHSFKNLNKDVGEINAAIGQRIADNLEMEINEYSGIKNTTKHLRERRSIYIANKKGSSKDIDDRLAKNTVDIDDKDEMRLGKVLHKLTHRLEDIVASDKDVAHDVADDESTDGIEEQLLLKSKITDNHAMFKVSEKTNNGFLHRTVGSVFSALDELKQNLRKIMRGFSLINSLQ